MVIADVLGLRGRQRAVEGYDDPRGLMVNAESLDVDHHRAHAQVIAGGLGLTGRPAGPTAVTVALLVYWPMVAICVVVEVQVSPGSSKPSWLVSPTLKPLTSTGEGGSRRRR